MTINGKDATATAATFIVDLINDVFMDQKRAKMQQPVEDIFGLGKKDAQEVKYCSLKVFIGDKICKAHLRVDLLLHYWTTTIKMRVAKYLKYEVLR